MLALYHNNGETIGRGFARRYIWEIGEAMAEVHGAQAAAAVLYGLADSVATRTPLGDLHTDKPADQGPEEPKASAAAPPARAPWPIRSIGWSLAILVMGMTIGWSAHQ